MLNKKTALLSLALLGSAFAIVGCSSNETNTAPESAQVTTAPDATATVEGVLSRGSSKILRLRLNPSNLHLRQHNNKA